MQALWKKRLAQHMRQQQRYLRLVFNDHFVLILMILFGGLLYFYSRFLKTLAVSWWLWLLIVLVSMVMLLPGRLVTLLQAADQIFLLPKASTLTSYLEAGRRYSLVLPLILIGMTSVLLAPLFALLGQPLVLTTLAFFVTGSLFKDAELFQQLRRGYFQTAAWFESKWVFAILVGLTVFVALQTSPGLMVLLAFGVNITARMRYRAIQAQAPLDLTGLITTEAQRSRQIYQFYNLFTDVPELGGQVHRRRYLDRLVNSRLFAAHEPWGYLFTRDFMRSGDYLGLFVRLLIVGIVIMLLLPTLWLRLALAVLWLYVLGFQLLPLYFDYDDVVLTHLFMKGTDGKTSAFVHLLRVLLAGQLLGFTLALIVVGHFAGAALLVVAGAVFIWLFSGWYLQLRVSRKQA